MASNYEVRMHAKSCAVRACLRGLWSGYTAGLHEDYVAHDGPSPEDFAEFRARHGRMTFDQVALWRAEWRKAAVRWIVPAARTCTYCDGHTTIDVDAGDDTRDVGCPRCGGTGIEMPGDPEDTEEYTESGGEEWEVSR